ALEVAPPLDLGELGLWRRGPHAPQPGEIERHAEARGDGPGEERALVVAALASAHGVKRHRDHDVDALAEPQRGLGELVAEPRPEIGAAMVLQPLDGLGDGAAVLVEAELALVHLHRGLARATKEPA